MWFYWAEITLRQRDSQSKDIEMGSCPAYMRSITVICVARSEGLVRERHGGMRIRGRMMVVARETHITKGLGSSLKPFTLSKMGSHWWVLSRGMT